MATDLNSELLQYLADEGFEPGQRLPSMHKLAQQLGIGVSKLREQIEVARAFGWLEVRPKTGIQFLGYQFMPGLMVSLNMALERDPMAYFEQFGVLRNHIEAGFWKEAVKLLEPSDKQQLRELVDRAWAQLQGTPIQIPHDEHRQLHLMIFKNLDNIFVQGILRAYWDMYETVGLNLFTDYQYLQEVWTYHEKMVDAILQDELEEGYQALIEHIGILQQHPEVGRRRPRQRVSAHSLEYME
jgi:DNA-binding FadR family transcriptional regulator